MRELALVAAVVVGAVLIVAGVSKLAAGERWPDEASALGAPRSVVPLVPWFEIALGAVLVVDVARSLAALLAAALFAAFTIVILRVLRAGRRPPCACFGSWSARELGPRHVARNLVLIGLSVVAAF